MKKNSFVFIFIILLTSVSYNKVFAQSIPNYQDSLNGVSKQIPSNKIFVVWNNYNCLHCYTILQNKIVKNNYDKFSIIKLIENDQDTNWAIHSKNIYFNKQSKIYFNFLSKLSNDTFSKQLITKSTPFILVPSDDFTTFKIYYFSDIFVNSIIRRGFKKVIRQKIKQMQ